LRAGSTDFRRLGSQQEAEKYYFDLFRQASGLVAIPDYGDKPDVILHLDRKIGVEITNLYVRPGSDDASEQRQRERRTKVVAAAQSHYRQMGGRDFELTIQFNAKSPIRSRRMAALTTELADLASRIERHSTGPIDPEVFATSPELLTVYLNAREYPDPRWPIAQVYTLDFISPQTLTDILREKEAKALEYQPCDAYWLLIIVDWVDRAQDQEITVNVPMLTSQIFERVILYKPDFNEIVDACSR
jgi:hypothetical protein